MNSFKDIDIMLQELAEKTGYKHPFLVRRFDEYVLYPERFGVRAMSQQEFIAHTLAEAW